MPGGSRGSAFRFKPVVPAALRHSVAVHAEFGNLTLPAAAWLSRLSLIRRFRMISAAAVPDSACLRANAICSSVKCFLPIKNPPSLAMSGAETLATRMDQKTERGQNVCRIAIGRPILF